MSGTFTYEPTTLHDRLRISAREAGMRRGIAKGDRLTLFRPNSILRRELAERERQKTAVPS
jgi:hypothetical protein